MKEIFVHATTGIGTTELAAFDNALYRWGVGNQNLIHLSSVIPSGFTVTEKPIAMNTQHIGDRLYVVYAEKRQSEPGLSAAAGLGWVTTQTNGLPWGLFVEHTGHSHREVEEQIHMSLNSMVSYRSEFEWSKIHSAITETLCENDPVAALALAVYQVEPW